MAQPFFSKINQDSKLCDFAGTLGGVVETSQNEIIVRSTAIRSGFTLIELLIVISLISILSAIAIPQFLSSREDAVESATLANLAIMRDAVERYLHQHDQTYPGTKPGGSEPSEEWFVNQMTTYTDRDGLATDTMDRRNYPYGPYLRMIPDNPNMDSGGTLDPDGIRVLRSASSIKPQGARATKGWAFNCLTGELIDNTDERLGQIIEGPGGGGEIEGGG